MGRRILFVAAVVGVVALALAGVSSAEVPTQDSVTGSGVFFGPAGLFEVAIDARSGPSGENPSGTVRVSPDFTGQVTCLHVSGNRALVGYVQADDPSFADVIEIDDNGPVGSDTDTLTENLDQFPTSESNCPTTLPQPGQTFRVIPPSPRVPLPPSDFVVADAQPPTSKDQCKNGGWAQFGFDNRRQCIRSVRQQARQECIFIRAADGRPAFRAHYGSGIHKRHAMRRCIRERMND
jgi:hypothetical protein